MDDRLRGLGLLSLLDRWQSRRLPASSLRRRVNRNSRRGGDREKRGRGDSRRPGRQLAAGRRYLRRPRHCMDRWCEEMGVPAVWAGGRLTVGDEEETGSEGEGETGRTGEEETVTLGVAAIATLLPLPSGERVGVRGLPSGERDGTRGAIPPRHPASRH